jgi:hypothetical protein
VTKIADVVNCEPTEQEYRWLYIVNLRANFDSRRHTYMKFINTTSIPSCRRLNADDSVADAELSYRVVMNPPPRTNYNASKLLVLNGGLLRSICRCIALFERDGDAIPEPGIPTWYAEFSLLFCTTKI